MNEWMNEHVNDYTLIRFEIRSLAGGRSLEKVAISDQYLAVARKRLKIDG